MKKKRSAWLVEFLVLVIIMQALALGVALVYNADKKNYCAICEQWVIREVTNDR